MKYKVARVMRPASRIDRYLERLNRAAKARIKPPGKKSKELVRGSGVWALLHRYTAEAVNRNEQFARNWTALECGEKLREQTFDRIKNVEKAWPVFERSVLAPLLNMGGIPPVGECFRIWFATGGNMAETFTAVRGSSLEEPNRRRRAVHLLEYERQLYTKAMGGRELRPIEPQGAYATLGPIFWEEQSRSIRKAISSKGLRNLPDMLADLHSLCAFVLQSTDNELPEPKKRQKVIDQLYFACLTSLSKAGWDWQVPPIQPIILVKNGIQICPQIWFQKLLEGSLSGAAFERVLDEQGLLALTLTSLRESKLFLM